MTRMSTKPERTWNILELLRWATEFFGKHGVEDPRVDAEVLLAHALEIPRIQLYAQFDRPLNAVELSTFKPLVIRRARDRAPVAYITGEREFWSLPLRVTEDVLIPRPDTERLVEEALLCLADVDGARIVDVGTGSGAIALALATERSEDVIFATDVSPKAIEVAQRNADLNGLLDRVEFRCGDLTTPVREEDPFDLVVSNPPYVTSDEYAGLAPELGHEPRVALEAGEDGLDVIRRLIEASVELLRPGGSLLFEIGATQGERASDLARERGYEDVEVRPDYAGHDRLVHARWPGR